MYNVNIHNTYIHSVNMYILLHTNTLDLSLMNRH